MTAAELIAELQHRDPNEPALVEAYISELSYVVDALEQWLNMMEIAGRTMHPEIDQFLARAQDAL